MSKDNESPDSGYDHFHEHGRRRPQSAAGGIPWKKAPDSGTQWTSPSGIDPKTGMPKAQTNVPGGSVGGEAKKLGIT